MLPLVGLPACERLVKETVQHLVPARYSQALIGVGVLPVIVPALADEIAPLLDRLDGLLLPGSPSNVAPALYGAANDETPEWHDAARDNTSLPLIRAAIERGIPVLGICRGVQELNVALGGTLHQQVHNLSGRIDHRGLGETIEDWYSPRHTVQLAGQLARMLGREEITVNSVHGQAIDLPAPSVCVEAMAPDGTIEAIRVMNAPGFAMGVQWHPEWGCAGNQDSTALFQAFADACRNHAAGLRRAA